MDIPEVVVTVMVVVYKYRCQMAKAQHPRPPSHGMFAVFALLCFGDREIVDVVSLQDSIECYTCRVWFGFVRIVLTR